MNSTNETPTGIPKPPPLPTSAQSSRPPPPPRVDSTGKQVHAPPPPPRPDSTGKQILAPASIRAPPPASQKVSFLPPAPARSGTTDPGGLQTRADAPHPKQKTPRPQAPPLAPALKTSPPPLGADSRLKDKDEKTPPNGIPSAAVPATGPGRVVGPPHASRLKDPSGSVPKAAPPSARPRSLPVSEKAGSAPVQADPLPSLRSIPSHSRLKAVFKAVSSFLFPKSPTRMAVIWGVITVALLSPVLGFTVHSCQEEKQEQKVEQKETGQKTENAAGKVEQKAKSTHSAYIPKALRKPPALLAKPMQGIPRARSRLPSA